MTKGLSGTTVIRIIEALGFDPTNHHNALACPYCNPNGLRFAAETLPPPAPGLGPSEPKMIKSARTSPSAQGWSSSDILAAFALGKLHAPPTARGLDPEAVARVIDQKTVDWARNAVDRHAKFFPASPQTLEDVVRNSSYEKPLSEALAKARTIIAMAPPADAGERG